MGKTKLSRANEKAKKYLMEKLGKSYCIFDLYAWINMSIDEEEKQEEIQKGITVFKVLFATKEEEILLVLWNVCARSLRKIDVRLLKKYFTEEEYAFLKRVKKAVLLDKGRYGFYNINKDIYTERLILRATNEMHNKAFKKEKESEGFLQYYMLGKFPVTKWYMRKYDISHGKLKFAVLLRETEKMIGLVEIEMLAIEPYECREGRISYYIFQEFRHKGYAQEAIESLMEALFQGRLYKNIDTNYDFIYKAKKVNITLLRAGIEVSNEASKQTVKNLGFHYEGIVHRALFDGKKTYDKENYYITKEIWKKEKGDKR